jgi:EmrB/QacA subfamily drug resistance transporter
MNRQWWILVAVGVGTFMSALDSSVVNTVLPVINRSLHSNVSTIEWVVVIYMLVVSGLLLSFGRLGDLRGHKRLYVSGFAVFILASALCGLAPGAGALIGFRVLQGVGAAMLFANSPAILTRNFPSTRRGEVLGLQASMTYLGLMIGPSLGGWLTGQFGWRIVFYMNVPVGLLALGLSQHFIPSQRVGETNRGFDLAGAIAWMCGLGALLLALNEGHAYGWTSLPILSLFAAAGLLLAEFLRIERRVEHPMLDLKLFEHRSFRAATLSAGLNYICVYSVVFLMPFYLIQGRGFSPARAGLLLTIPSLVRAVASPLSGALSDRIGTRQPSLLGMAILAFGLYLLSRLGGQSSVGQMAAALSMAGLGAGLFVSPNTSAVMGAAPRHQQGIAAGVMATARNVGMALGVGLAGAFLTTILAHGPGSNPSMVLFRAVDAGFLTAMGVAALGVVTCAAGGSGGVEQKSLASAPVRNPGGIAPEQE